MTNEEIIAVVKGAITTSTGGLVNPQELQSFIELVVKNSTFLTDIRVETGIQKSLELSTLGIASRVLRKGVEGEAPDSTGVTIGKRTLTPAEVILYTEITYSWLRKAIGGTADLNPDGNNAALEQVNNLIAAQFANDLVDLAWNGKKTTTPANAFVNILDGYLTKAAADDGTHKDTFGDTDKVPDILGEMLDLLPNQYRNRTNELRYFVSPKMESAYRKALGSRNTALGDLMMTKNEPVYYNGILVNPVFAVPDTALMLTMSQNLAVGFGQQMLVEREKDIKKRTVDIVMTSEVDVEYAISDAVVIFTHA